MVTLIVGETTDQMEWHLPTYDPQNQNKYHYKLHSLDIYFWKQEDALKFVNGIRFVLPPSQVEILDEPVQQQQQQHHTQVHQPAPVSSVVQQLEHVAISDPYYGTPKPPTQGAPSFAAPPTSAVPAPEQPPASFVPMAYNPAAPAAPETIRHREKTPPPEDGIIDPLAAVVAYDAQAPFSPGFVPPPGFQSGQAPGIGLPPPPPPPQFGGHAVPQPGLQRAATMPVQAVHSGLASPGLSNPYGSPYPSSPGFQPPPPPPPPQQQQPQQQHTLQPQQQVQQAPPQVSTPQAAPSIVSPATPASPPGGFSQYTYSGSNTQQQPGANDYSIHQQAYRPTEMEANKYKGYAGKQDPSGKMEQNMGRLEKGVTGMFRKFEKKFG